MMNAIFEDEIIEGWLTVYMDDMLIATNDDPNLHTKYVHRILDKLEKHDLYLKPEKCVFTQRRIEFLGVVLEGNTIQMDPTKIKGVAEWPHPRNPTDIRSFLGFTGFYRYFIPNYSCVARPLLDLTKKATPWIWTTAQTTAFEMLKKLMCSKPVLTQPQYDKPFVVHTDASAYGVGAILLQEGEINPQKPSKPRLHPIAYYSVTFTPTERNYDIYKRELLAVLKALQNWRPHLAWTPRPFTLITDHANLTFWKHPRKVNRRVARWFAELQDYWFEIKHVPGKTHTAADFLSRPFIEDKGEKDNEDVTVLPPKLFVNDEPMIRVFDIDSIFGELDEAVADAQEQHWSLMKEWQKEYDATTISSLRPPYGEIPGWRKQGRLVVPPNLALKRKVMFHIHDAVGPKHPNKASTLRQTLQSYWWPDAKEWITRYVDNCEQCHGMTPSVKTLSLTTLSLRAKILEAQERHRTMLDAWKTTQTIEKKDNWLKDGRLVIPSEEILKREILQLLHDAPTAGHPGRDETFTQVSNVYWWPGMRTWITEYVAGCATCQQNKNVTHRTRAPLYRISTPDNALPFQQIALDLITGLPPNGPHDSILTIVDHGCSRAAVFLPCATTITGLGVAQLYFDNVYRWFGLPSKVISDRDPRFTSHFGRALANKIGAKQNLSTAFHPQTDGLSERKNQWVEQYLRLVANAQQGDWSKWLTVASAVHNDHVNATLGTTPSEVLLGYRPTLHPNQERETNNQAVERRLEIMTQRRAQAIAAINKTAHKSPTPIEKFKIGDQVWLEASHLKLPYHTPKLAPRRQGPFRVSKIISPVAYQLALPLSWGIHNVFHASLLLPYRETTAYGPNFGRPPPELIEDVEEYEVEAIVNHRQHGRQRQLQYLIKWRGYPSSDNTWEPEGNVHAEDLVKEYHRRHPLHVVKRAAGRGTKKLIRALQIPISSPLPTEKIKAWLLAGVPEAPFPRIRVAPPPTNECSGSPPTSLWPSRPFKLYRSGFQGRVQGTPGNSYSSSPTSYEPTSEIGKGTPTLKGALATVVLKDTLRRATRQATSPRTLLCPTLPSGRGRPR